MYLSFDPSTSSTQEVSPEDYNKAKEKTEKITKNTLKWCLLLIPCVPISTSLTYLTFCKLFKNKFSNKALFINITVSLVATTSLLSLVAYLFHKTMKSPNCTYHLEGKTYYQKPQLIHK